MVSVYGERVNLVMVSVYWERVNLVMVSVYGERVNLVMVSAWLLVLWTSLLYRQMQDRGQCFFLDAGTPAQNSPPSTAPPLGTEPSPQPRATLTFSANCLVHLNNEQALEYIP